MPKYGLVDCGVGHCAGKASKLELINGGGEKKKKGKKKSRRVEEYRIIRLSK